MDVKQILCLLGFVVLLGACAPQKTSQTVFPTNNQKNGTLDPQCQQAEVTAIPNQFVVTWEDGHISVESSENSDLFVNSFVEPQLKKIKHVEYDRWIRVKGSAIHSNAVATSQQWAQDIVQLNVVHSQGVKGDGVLVAIIDTPVDYTHPQLKSQMIAGWDFVSNSARAAAPHEHATHIAGIIGAEEGGPINGMAPKAKMMGVSFMDSSGAGTMGAAIQAMQFAVAHGAKILNNSWGGSQCSDTLKAALQGISDQGVLIMTAAGNDGVDIERYPSYPATFAIPLQIVVGASNSSNVMSTFSNTSWTLVHLFAPGEEIYSTIPGGYDYLSGTSMATPFVTGAAALLMSAKPAANPSQIRQALLSSVDLGPFRSSSGGRLNVQRAIDEIRRLVP